MPDNRERSVSNDVESSDIGSPNDAHETAANPPAGKPGRKKNPNSQAARRDQNRIAQREFRLRKQQRIRDLEASVEILSGGKDEALSQFRAVLKDLMAENQVLRSLLKNLSTFIGEGAGGTLAKMGWDMGDFNEFVNKGETDTAWESYQRHKREFAAAAGASSSSQKRSLDDDPYGLKPKRARAGDANGDVNRGQEGFALVLPPGSTVGPSLYGQGRVHDGNGMMPDLSRASASGMFVPGASIPSPGQFTPGTAGSPSMSMAFQSSYMGGMSGGGDGMQSNQLPMLNTNLGGMGVTSHRSSISQSEGEPGEDMKNHDAFKLVHYHLDNYKRNNNYCLPSSLRPTLVQRTIPHESVIDGILHPELRDRMILLREKFDLVDALHDYRLSVTIHGDDVLAHHSWEISEEWLRRYKLLVEPATLAITNKWRRDRGEPELHAAEYLTDTLPNV